MLVHQYLDNYGVLALPRAYRLEFFLGFPNPLQKGNYTAVFKFPKGMYVYSRRMLKARQIPKGFYVKMLQT